VAVVGVASWRPMAAEASIKEMSKLSRRTRKPRPPLALPATSFDAAREAAITAVVEYWYGLIAAALSSEAGQLAVQGDIYRQVKAGDAAALPLDYIVAMADAQHPPADHALRRFIHEHIDADAFAELPVQLRAFAQRSLRRPPAAGYPSNAPQVVTDLTRDIAICILIDQIAARWPDVPKLYSTGRRRSAAAYVGLVFTWHGTKLAEKTVRRIYGARPTLARRLAEFLMRSAT
jgi:hypothetical protein